MHNHNAPTRQRTSHTWALEGAQRLGLVPESTGDSDSWDDQLLKSSSDRDPRSFRWGFFLQANTPAAPLGGFHWFPSVEQSALALLYAYGEFAEPGESTDVDARKALSRLLWEVFWGALHPAEARAAINRLLPRDQIVWWGCWEEMRSGAVEMPRWFRGWYRNGGESTMSRILQRPISDEEEGAFLEALCGFNDPLDWFCDRKLEEIRQVIRGATATARAPLVQSNGSATQTG